MSVYVDSREADFDVGAELTRLEALGGGAVASFTGIVRGENGIAALRLETYAVMAAGALKRIADEAMVRWDLLGLTLIHRHGRFVIGDRIVLVGTASRHRAAALEACAYLIDWAKTAAPYWKQEILADGTMRWVEPRAADDVAAAAWGAPRGVGAR